MPMAKRGHGTGPHKSVVRPAAAGHSFEMQEATESLTRPRPAPPTIREIFLAFATVSLSGFGGVLPWARRMVIEQRRWMTAEEFNEAFALGQFLPGPNMVNFCIVFGTRYGGAAGAFAAFAGVVFPPITVVMLLGALYARYGEIAAVQHILVGLSAAAAGMIIAAAARMTEPLFRRVLSPAPFVALAAFGAIGIGRMPLLWVLLAATPVSVLLAWWWRR